MLPRNTFVVVGPESTGKTSLCQELAAYYKSPWIPEFARFYIEQLNRPYTYDDVIYIAQKQIEIEANYKSEKNFLFIDTDLIITKVWLVHVFKKCPLWIDEHLKKSYRKAYLVTYPDIPWEYDPLRENPHIRDYLFEWYVEEIKTLNVPYFIVKGKGRQRFENSKAFINSIIDV
ncbi:MAG: ATP-binding protein [Bacteroidales bacterium]|nr:ATP-binding protein [Bacteroidales bacterium]